MDVASIQAELHRYYDQLTSGICLIGMEPGEPILFVNKGMLKIYHCMDEAEFYRFTGRRFQGMVDGEDYYPIAHMSEPDSSEFVTFRFRTRDDHFRRAEGSASVISLEDGTKAWLLQIISSELKGSSAQNDPLTAPVLQASFAGSPAGKSQGTSVGILSDLFQPHELPPLQFSPWPVCWRPLP